MTKAELQKKIAAIDRLMHSAVRQAHLNRDVLKQEAYYQGVAEGLSYALKLVEGEMPLRYIPWGD